MNRIFYVAAGVAVCGFFFLAAARFGIFNVADSFRYAVAAITVGSGLLAWASSKNFGF